MNRVKFLSEKSMLKVVWTKTDKHSEGYYEFYNGHRCIFSCYSYSKAKAFALGIEVGRNQNIQIN